MLFVFNKDPAHYDTWRDGLWAALRLVARNYTIQYLNVNDIVVAEQASPMQKTGIVASSELCSTATDRHPVTAGDQLPHQPWHFQIHSWLGSLWLPHGLLSTTDSSQVFIQVPGVCLCGVFMSLLGRHGDPHPKALCIGGNAVPPPDIATEVYDLLFFETEWYRETISFHPMIRQAFGINSNIYHGIPHQLHYLLWCFMVEC